MSLSETDLARKFLEVIPRSMWSIRTEMRRLAQSELTVTQFRVLAQLAREPSNNRVLAENIGVTVPAMSRLVDLLVRQGWVLRETPPGDRRQVSLTLSARGRRKYDALRGEAQRHFSERFLKLTSAQRHAFAEGLSAMEDLLP